MLRYLQAWAARPSWVQCYKVGPQRYFPFPAMSSDTHFEPSYLEFNGNPGRGKQNLPGSLPATSSTPQTLDLLSYMASYDVASGICPALIPDYVAVQRGFDRGVGRNHRKDGARRGGRRQGLTLVHFSAQLKPCWSHLFLSPCLIDWGKSCTQRIPRNVLTLSRKVDECKPVDGGRDLYIAMERARRLDQGRVVQVDPFKPSLKAPGI